MDILNEPLFGFVLTIFAFEIGLTLYKKTKFPLFNPVLIATLIIVGLLLTLKIPLNHYNNGANMLSIFLGPVTVALAVPLYRQLDLLKRHLVPVLIGCFVGVVTSVVSVVVLSKIFGLNKTLLLSMTPKSITTPIGLAISESLGGIPSITIVAIMVTGITGAIVAPTICKVFKIKEKVAIGIGIGVASHAVGTSKAIEMGEVEGSMSGLAIGLAGIITIFVIPIMLHLLGIN